MESKDIKIKIKKSKDVEFELSIKEKSSIYEVKLLCEEETKIKPSEMKLIFKGFYFIMNEYYNII